jgi:hypothetical protein
VKINMEEVVTCRCAERLGAAKAAQELMYNDELTASSVGA